MARARGLAARLRRRLLHALGAHALEAVVVAGIERQRAVMQVQDMRRHGVEDVAVVADEQQPARPAPEEGLQPEAGLEVEVVGGLVEQEQVRLGEQGPGQRHAHAPAAGEAGERPRLHRGVEAEAVEDRRGARRRRIRRDRGEALVDVRQLAGIGGLVGRGGEQARALGVAGEDVLDRGLVAAGRLLRDEADARAAGELDLAAVGLQLARDQREQRRLARAVASHEAHAPSRGQRRGGALEDLVAAKAQRHVGDGQHGGRADSTARAGTVSPAEPARRFRAAGRMWRPAGRAARLHG